MKKDLSKYKFNKDLFIKVDLPVLLINKDKLKSLEEENKKLEEEVERLRYVLRLHELDIQRLKEIINRRK